MLVWWLVRPREQTFGTLLYNSTVIREFGSEPLYPSPPKCKCCTHSVVEVRNLTAPSLIPPTVAGR
jgi:hypothetical protein